MWVAVAPEPWLCRNATLNAADKARCFLTAGVEWTSAGRTAQTECPLWPNSRRTGDNVKRCGAGEQTGFLLLGPSGLSVIRGAMTGLRRNSDMPRLRAGFFNLPRFKNIGRAVTLVHERFHLPSSMHSSIRGLTKGAFPRGERRRATTPRMPSPDSMSRAEPGSGTGAVATS